MGSHPLMSKSFDFGELDNNWAPPVEAPGNQCTGRNTVPQVPVHTHLHNVLFGVTQAMPPTSSIYLWSYCRTPVKYTAIIPSEHYRMNELSSQWGFLDWYLAEMALIRFDFVVIYIDQQYYQRQLPLEHSQQLHRLYQLQQLQPMHQHCRWLQQQMHALPSPQQIHASYAPAPVNTIDIFRLAGAYEVMWHQELQLRQWQIAASVAAAGLHQYYIHPVLPAGFPPHPDSIQVEVFSQQNAYTHEPLKKLYELHQSIIGLHAGVIAQAPTKYSYVRANHPSIPVRFGVSAPHSQSPSENALAEMVRAYRIRESWGHIPPLPEEGWKHGQCAEYQSLPSVVRDCERNGLENVVIETMTIDKSGKPVGMCKNCVRYVSHRLLHKQPTWSIRDVARNMLYT